MAMVNLYVGGLMKNLLVLGPAVLAGIYFLAGCGDGGESLDCAWLEGENCWKDSLQAAQPCAHDSTVDGTLSADETKCTFTDGTEISFAAPLDLANMDDPSWDFEIKTNGSFCMSWKDKDEGTNMTLTTSLGTFRENVSGMSMTIQCPDGGEFTISNAMSLLECENAFSILPGFASSWTDTSVTLSLNGGANGYLQLFSCSK
jgi:hypothetical protein